MAPPSRTRTPEARAKHRKEKNDKHLPSDNAKRVCEQFRHRRPICTRFIERRLILVYLEHVRLKSAAYWLKWRSADGCRPYIMSRGSFTL